MPTRFDPEINRLRARLRGHHQPERLAKALAAALETIPVAALAANNFGMYVGANSAACTLTGYSSDELAAMSVMSLTPTPQSEAGAKLWQEFVASGTQRGEYELRRKNGSVVQVRYWAYASVAPGIHLSLLVPATTGSR